MSYFGNKDEDMHTVKPVVKDPKLLYGLLEGCAPFWPRYNYNTWQEIWQKFVRNTTDSQNCLTPSCRPGKNVTLTQNVIMIMFFNLGSNSNLMSKKTSETRTGYRGCRSIDRDAGGVQGQGCTWGVWAGKAPQPKTHTTVFQTMFQDDFSDILEASSHGSPTEK